MGKPDAFGAWGDNQRRIAASLTLFAGVMLLAACEAPLDLSKVQAERTKAIYRYDEFQAGIEHDGRVVMVGLGGAVIESADQGQSWSRTELAVTQGLAPSLIDIAECPNGDIVVLDIARRLWTRAIGQTDWGTVAIPTDEDVLALTCDQQDRLWVVGSFSLILRSEDGGATWDDLSTGEDSLLTTISFVGSGVGFITGEFGTILKSKDGGDSWQAATAIPNELYVQEALFIDPQTGWISGLNGIVYRTDDGGENWQREETPTQAPLYRLARTPDAMFAAGNYGTLLRNDGTGWRAVPRKSGGFGYIRALVPLGSGHLIVGGAGMVDVLSVKGGQMTSLVQAWEMR